jgi:uncharacterized repeat protein (TIGR02543 family)
MKQQNELAGSMRKLAIFLTTIAFSCVGFASSPANALGTPYSCTTGGFYVLNGVVFGGGPLEGDCTGLASIPESATSIGAYAFSQAVELKTVTFASNSQVETIGEGAFLDAITLERVDVPNSVNSIDIGAFSGTTALKSIVIPKDLTSIGNGAFRSSGVTNFQIASENNSYSSTGGVLFNKNKTTLIRFPATPTTEYAVPERVTSIAPFAFENNLILGAPNLSKITLPSSMLSIGDNALYGASTLTSITIPDSVTEIGSYALAYTGLESITIPSGVDLIYDNAFTYSPIVKFYFLRSMAYEPGSDSDSDSSNGPWPFSLPTAQTPKVYIPVGAGDYGFNGDFWKGLTIDVGYRATFLGNGSTSGTAPQQIMRGGIDTFLVPGNSGGLKRTGYTFAGWNSAADGKGTSFAANASKAFDGEDLNFYAKWIKNAEATTKPSISGTATSTATGKNKLTAAKGKWTGTPAPTYATQWYSCSAQVKAVTQTIPASCKAISRATATTLSVTNTFKNKYLAVAVKGTVAGTPATQWLSKSTLKVK